MPFNLSGTANIQVTYGTNTSDMVSVPVTATFPGLFAQQIGGLGQAKALNQDGTVNSLQTPAKRGSYVTVYGVGLGAVTPALAAGQAPPMSPLSITTNPAAASIGGAPAAVSFSGLAPGFTGLYQINILVPADAPTGRQDVVISNANNASQNGLYIFVASN
jgi:adhesin/invasin